jgi:hypothetical protein
VALRRAADGTGGGVLFPSAVSGLNAFGCAPETKLVPSDGASTTEMRLEDLALCLECPPESGCVPSRPVDLARALDASSPGDGPASSRLHLGALVASRRPPRAGPEAKPTLATRRAGGSRATNAPVPPSPPRSPDTDAAVPRSRANGHDETEKTKTRPRRPFLFSVACASALKSAVSVAAALAFLATAPR